MSSKLADIRKILGWKPDQYLGEVNITPAMANKLLAFNTNNRARNKQREKEYTADMTDGKFVVSESMIGFDHNGVLTNGQSRLYSCVNSGETLFSVVYLKLEQNLHMDTGRTRKTVENIQLSNALNGICNDKDDTIKSVKTLLRVANSTPRVRDEEVINFCKKYGKLIDKASDLGLLNLHGGKPALFKAEIAAGFLSAAINGVDLDDLVHIRNVLTDGDKNSACDEITKNMRDKALELYGNNSGSVRKQIYLGMQYTIFCYVNKKKNTLIQFKNEYYPVI